MKNKKYFNLTLIKPTTERRYGSVIWICLCDCGNTTKKAMNRIKSGHNKSCGCLVNNDLTNRFFGRLLVVKKHNKRAKNGHILWKCRCECGKIHFVKTGNLLNGRTKSCGCLHKEIVSGKNNYNWNPKLTDKDRVRNRDFQKMTDWRIAVYERDNYTCQLCLDDTGNNLVAHHLDGYNWCKEKRCSLNNGVCLCENCHDLYHGEYGYGNNTAEEFFIFYMEYLSE